MCKSIQANKEENDSIRLILVLGQHLFPYVERFEEKEREKLSEKIYHQLQRNCRGFSDILDRPDPHGPWLNTLDSSIVKKADFIALVHIFESANDKVYGNVTMAFKRRCSSDGQVILVVKNNDFDFTAGMEFLIFAKERKDCSHYVDVDEDSRIIQKDNSKDDIEFLRSSLPCFNPELKEYYKDRACHRDYRPVCGCDSVTYGNQCEALKSGVAIFVIGECKK